MSGAAIGWAWKQRVPMATAKFVLLELADQTTDDLVFQSVSTIATRTGLDRKTVMHSIARLVEWGLLEDTGERRGRTGSVPVYRMLMSEGLFDNAPYPSSTRIGTGTKSGTATKNGTASPGSGTTFPSKRYQKRDTDPRALDPKASLFPRARAHEAPTPAHPGPAAGETVYPGGFDAGCTDPPTASAPTPSALACTAMREAGMPLNGLNPSHPELRTALAAGVTARELADVTREVVGRGGAPPNLVYVVRTALGRRRDAASPHSESSGHAQPVTRQASRRAPLSAVQRALRNSLASAGAETGFDGDP